MPIVYSSISFVCLSFLVAPNSSLPLTATIQQPSCKLSFFSQPACVCSWWLPCRVLCWNCSSSASQISLRAFGFGSGSFCGLVVWMSRVMQKTKPHSPSRSTRFGLGCDHEESRPFQPSLHGVQLYHDYHLRSSRRLFCSCSYLHHHGRGAAPKVQARAADLYTCKARSADPPADPRVSCSPRQKACSKRQGARRVPGSLSPGRSPDAHARRRPTPSAPLRPRLACTTVPLWRFVPRQPKSGLSRSFVGVHEPSGCVLVAQQYSRQPKLVRPPRHHPCHRIPRRQRPAPPGCRCEGSDRTRRTYPARLSSSSIRLAAARRLRASRAE